MIVATGFERMVLAPSDHPAGGPECALRADFGSFRETVVTIFRSANDRQPF
jgi:hypothetical protein